MKNQPIIPWVATVDQTVLAISDEGIGFKAPEQGGTGMGLRTMQYRAGMIGDALLVLTPAKGGTRIVCFLQNSGSRAVG